MEIERARENFPLTYLPEEAEGLFKEALNCYAAGCFNAFGAMSRRTAQSLFRELGERGKLELFDTLQEIRTLAELDDDTFAALRAVLFGSDSDPWPHHPDINAERAGVLLGSHARSAVSDLRAQGAPAASDDLPQVRRSRHRPRPGAERQSGGECRAPCARPTNTRALRNSRIQPPSSDHSFGRQEFCTVRNTRSGCGITEVTRPSALHSPARPSAEPFGLKGYFCVGCSRLSTYCNVTRRPAHQLAALDPAVELGLALAVRHRRSGSTEPCMPANSTDCDGGTRTSVRRASYCSDRLRTNRGQPPPPGSVP